jgi:non-specific protein-tyrosine kinase
LNQEPQQESTLRESLAVLRRRRLVILAITIIGAAMALGLSLTQTKVYEAQASLRIIPSAEAFAAAGVPPSNVEPVQFSAAQAALTVTRPRVLTGARERLELDESIEYIESRVTALTEPKSNLVQITAQWPTATGAAQVADAVAAEAVEAATEEERAKYAELADQLREDFEAIPEEEVDRRLQTSNQIQRLDSLATLLEPSEVVERAVPPSGPASPKPVRNAILGGFLGLVLGLVAASLLEALDRRIRRPDEAQNTLGLPLLAVVADHAMGGVPISNVPAEEHVGAMDSFRRLRTNIGYMNRENPPRTILVTSALPEEGKTTVATGLALASAAAGRRTLLVEGDLSRPVHAVRLGTASSPGLVDYLAGNAQPEQILQLKKFADPGAVTRGNGATPETSTLTCISAGSARSWSAEMLGTDEFAAFLTEVREAYEVVVIDSAPLLAVAETLQMAPLVDVVLLCVRLNRTTVDEAKAGLEALRRLPDRPTGLVVTGARTDTPGYSYYSYAYTYAARPETKKSRWPRRAAKQQIPS